MLRKVLMTEHNIKSHKQSLDNPKSPLDLSNWTVSIISEDQFSILQQMKKTAAFWQVVRMSAAEGVSHIATFPFLTGSEGR